MRRPKKASLIGYGAGLLVGCGIAYAYVSAQEFGSLSAADRYRVLCDGFTIPGMLALFAALLLMVSGQGALDGIGYCLSRAVHVLSFRGTERETYRNYLDRHQGSRLKGYGFLYAVGLTLMAIAVCFLALFHGAK